MGAVQVTIGQLIDKAFAYSRAKALAVGVALLAVPTLYSIFPDATRWWVGWRIVITALWLVLAVATVRGAVVRDEAIEQLSEEHRIRAARRRLLATADTLDALLRPGTRGIPEDYEFTVYTLDDVAAELRPFYPRMWFPGADPRIFAVGKGATGGAFAERRTFLVTGSAVASDKFGLTSEQQQFFKKYRCVVSTPFWSEGSEPFGVLTAISLKNDRFFEGDTGRTALERLAEVVGVVLHSLPDPDDLG